LFSNPLYGGTDHFIRHVLPRFGVEILAFNPTDSKEEIIALVQQSGKGDKLKMLYLETPANPNNQLTDIGMCREIADHFSTKDERVIMACDNTYMGPVWQHPIKHGADLVLYSATKYIGGHSDLIAGACLGSAHYMKTVKEYRTFLGNMAAPHTGWLLMRSLETLKVRMDEQARNAVQVAAFLNAHPKVEKIYYLGYPENERQKAIVEKQCLSFGAMISFDIKGGEAEAFRFLNSLKLIKLAVSLGSTESLAEHPASMTHIGVAPEDKQRFNISDKLVRLSIGVEFYEDLISDIAQALDHV
jgi:methionine-gamma-lyase